MEKERSRSGFTIKKRDLVLSTVLAASISAGVKSGSEAREPYQPEAYPDSAFAPLIIDDNYRRERSSVIPYSNMEISSPSPSPLSEKKQKQMEIQAELTKVIGEMSLYPKLFNDKKIADVKMYYPVYKEVADKFKIDWYLLFVVHEAETGASRGERGFKSESYYVGAMQRDPNIWPDSYVNDSADGLESLAKLPQRHKSDWKEIAAAAHMLSNNFHKYKQEGNSKNEAVLKALLLYSADGPARERFEKYKKYGEIFKDN